MKQLACLDAATLKTHSDNYKSNAIVEIDRLLNSGFSPCPVQRRYLQRIRSFVDKDECLIAEADSLKGMVEQIEREFFQWEKDVPPMLDSLNKQLVKAFPYVNFRDKAKEGGAWLMRQLVKEVKYCPYCNAETVYSVERDEQGDIKSSFDHFYPKGRYPFLAISLYNLIPSCYRCNSQFKKGLFKEPFGTFHPYIDDLDREVEFYLSGLTDDMLNGKVCSDGLSIKLKARDISDLEVTRRVGDYNIVFALDSVYTQLFADDALDVFRKAKIFNEHYLAMVAKWFRGAGIEVSVEKIIYNTILNRADINKCRLSKLIQDLRAQCTSRLG